MRIFVAGATGYIGQAVVRELVAAGHAVTGLARNAAKAEAVAALGAAARAGDLTDPGGLAAAAADHDVLIHVANFYGDDRPAVDRAATLALIDGARAAAAAPARHLHLGRLDARQHRRPPRRRGRRHRPRAGGLHASRDPRA